MYKFNVFYSVNVCIIPTGTRGYGQQYGRNFGHGGHSGHGPMNRHMQGSGVDFVRMLFLVFVFRTINLNKGKF